MWKEVVEAYFKALSQHLPGGAEKSTKTSFGIGGATAQIRTRHPPRTQVTRLIPSANLFGYAGNKTKDIHSLRKTLCKKIHPKSIS
jgi:hypothetical protein